MKKIKITRLAAYVAVAIGLAACGSDGGSGRSGDDGSTTSPQILDETQAQLSGILTGLGNQLSVIDKNSPLKLGAFVTCLDPTVNQLVDGPDGLLTSLLGVLNTGVNGGINNGASALNPELIQTGILDLAGGLQSLTVTLPQALLALVGQGTCTGSSTPGGKDPLKFLTDLANKGGSNNPLKPLFDALLAAGAPSNGGGSGPTGTPLDVLLGPLTQLASGGGNLGDIQNLADVVNILGGGVQQLGVALTGTLASQTEAIPVIGGLTELLSDALTDVGKVLTDLDDGATTNQELLTTINNLLTNLTATLAIIPGSSALTTPLNSAITQLTGALSAITTPLTDLLAKLLGLPGSAGSSGGTLPTSQIPVLGGLLDALLGPLLSLGGDAGAGSGSGSGSGSSESPLDALNNIPVIGPILGGLLGGLFGAFA